jgi:hypothetical protein
LNGQLCSKRLFFKILKWFSIIFFA